MDLDDVIYNARAGQLDDLKEASSEQYVAKDESGNTALHMASANGHTAIVKWIIEQFLPLGKEGLTHRLNVQNELGNTPLHWAALNGHLDIVQLLIEHGADCKIKNESGKTAIYEAQQSQHEKIAELFLQTMIEEEPEEPMDEDEQFVETGVPSSKEA